MTTLTKVDVCILDDEQLASVREMPLNIPSKFPSSQLRQLGSQLSLRGGVWSLGSNEDCCTKFVPDSKQDVQLQESITAAFASSARIMHLADRVVSKMENDRAGAPIVGPTATKFALHNAGAVPHH